MAYQRHAARHAQNREDNASKFTAVCIGILCGLVLGWVVLETIDMMFTSSNVHYNPEAQLQDAVAPQTSLGRRAKEKFTQMLEKVEKAAGYAVSRPGMDGVSVKESLYNKGSNPTSAAATSASQESPRPATTQSPEIKLAGEPSTSESSSLSKNSSPLSSTASSTTSSTTLSSKPKGDTIHTLMTSSGSGYQNFQGRIMYGTYKIVQGMSGGDKLTGFTRILHRVKPDECMDEIPTFHAKPLHPECDVWCDFPVADRPNAVAQWVDSVKADPSKLLGAWVLLTECDYVWIKPMPVPGDAISSDVPGWQFHFGYIIAQHPDCAHIIKRLYGGGDPAEVPNSGPAPAILRFSELGFVMPFWEKVTAAIEADPEAVKVLGWVREMYAWDIALAQAKVKILTEDPPKSPLIAQPPADHTIGNAAMFHYTWGAIYNDTTHTVWRWEKRDFTQPTAALKPKLLPMPPEDWAPGKWHLQGNEQVTEEMHKTLASMIKRMNEAIDTLPDLTEKYKALQSA
ncbi:hypothetical protein CEUSTIGMA_g8346.t1 [Chlamydomonas eustigma]|uniref:Hydroxyproline O-arabinosyltransferase-like domain-containing protein n=1 Tax=Chlamydomonas eustigma TaxID=1157962 RepID=A0A250XCV4_9CHLO|nr:hypothetical protein CEUSTIGMA_g8346.t1 [Chlamydomonas eustigma]|eukprot:GAX80911.1 hypothetical protein CEUSTIGMA_g8346.t1 [Chlamydomonas eustigma]